MEGPRALRPEELDSLRALTAAVFRPSLVDEYPQLFNEDNHENLRVCLDEGRCVSHVGMTLGRASLFGVPIQTACIGGVGTYKEYRGRGLASACFDAAVDRAYQAGADIMIVSGDRNLYRMRGCLRVGRDARFTLTSDTQMPRTSQDEPPVTIEVMKPEELPLVMDCYRREPVRFLRSPDDYRYALQCGFVMNRASDFVVIRQGNESRGYLIVQRPEETKRAGLAEFAGDRHAVLVALPEVMRRYGLESLSWQVSRHDRLFHSLCEGAGLTATPTPAAGTVKLIHFAQLMERLRSYWEERLGRRDAARLAFRQHDDEYGFRFGDEERLFDRDTTTRLLFGTVDGAEAQALAEPGRLTDVLKTILPLPCLWYGINYV